MVQLLRRKRLSHPGPVAYFPPLASSASAFPTTYKSRTKADRLRLLQLIALYEHTPPLDIPEVLEPILAYLDLPDRLVARLVCRRWNNAARHSIRIRTTWAETPVPLHCSLVLNHLRGIDSLLYTASRRDHCDATSNHVAWSRLYSRIRSGNATGLQELTVDGVVDLNERIAPLFPFLPSLSSLNIQGVCPSFSINMLLNACPQLRYLNIVYKGSETFPPGMPTTGIVVAGPWQTPYPLESLILERVSIAQESIMTLVECCPELRELKLINLQEPHPVAIDRGQLLVRVQRACPWLQSLHCSATEDQGDVVTPLLQFSFLNSIGVSGNIFGPELFPFIDTLPNTLTTLSILDPPTAHDRRSFGEALHNYLCSSPHLLHLIAPDVQYDDRFLDMRLANPLDRIWACRRLQTLSITFVANSDEALFGRLSECSRMMFGYISQVCPRLRSLDLARDRLDCSLTGGLCLLAFLEDLESLVIRTETLSILHPFDFSWMDNDPSIFQRITKRMSYIESRTTRSMRAKFEWLGFEDCRGVDMARLEYLGLLEPLPATSLLSLGSDSGNSHLSKRQKRDSANIVRRHRRSSSGSSATSLHSIGATHSWSSTNVWDGTPPRLILPHLKAIAIRQVLDRRRQAGYLQHFVRKVRPDIVVST